MINFIPIYAYAKKYNVEKQTVYRWIREGKFSKDDYHVETITINRLRIKENAINPLNKNV